MCIVDLIAFYHMAQSSAFAFEERLKGYVNYVKQHEDPIIQTMALSLMPQDQFERDAMALTNWPYDDDIRIVAPLIQWYHDEFFKWVDQPDCTACQSPTCEPYQPSGFEQASILPTAQESIGAADRVEIYKCLICQKLERFPRYNNPAILLETRRGRCGEWANCFYLFLRALGLRARFVLDWTDHVWCEVYSKSTRQWLHVDPCEAAIDKPLVYEVGWGKKLSYIIAFSNEEVVDVTWRYVRNRKAIVSRRNQVSEKVLAEILKNLNRAVQASFHAEQRNELARMRVWEIADMLKPKKISKGEAVGRQSGSAQWRVSRGEAKASECGNSFGTAIKPTNQEIIQRRLLLSYNCALDKYERGDGTFVGGWKSLLWKCSNVFRKVESYWKQAYLCRNEGSAASSIGSITWFFDLRDCNAKLSIKSLVIRVKSETFAVGTVLKLVVRPGNDETVSAIADVTLDKNDTFEFHCGKHFHEPLKSLLLTVIIGPGGNGDVAWQHAQLFRQSLIDDRMVPAFQVDIELAD